MQNPVIQNTELNPHVSVDCVIFGFDFNKLNVLLIERKEGQLLNENSNSTDTTQLREWALPGDHIRDVENLDQSANRVLYELTNLENIYLEQFHAFGGPNRANENDRRWMRSIRKNPNARVITVAYYSLVRIDQYHPSASSFAQNAAWFPVDQIPTLAFDHNKIVGKALDALRLKLKLEPIGFELLPPKFTLSQLRKLYEIILGAELEKRNFRRKILKNDFLMELDEKQKGVPHKAARLYKFDKEEYERKQAIQGDLNFVF